MGPPNYTALPIADSHIDNREEFKLKDWLWCYERAFWWARNHKSFCALGWYILHRLCGSAVCYILHSTCIIYDSTNTALYQLWSSLTWKTCSSMKGFSKHLCISSFGHFNMYSNQGIIIFLVQYLHAFLLEIAISVGDLNL